MTLLYVLLAVLIVLCCLIAWRQFQAPDRSEEQHETTLLREMLENMRRDFSDTKDRLQENLNKNAQGIQERLESNLKLMNQQVGGMDQRIDKRVSEINKRLDAAAQLMGNVSKQYGTVEQLSGDIKRLQEAFKAPKPRGNFSEKLLVDLARQILPIQKIHPQHTFRSTGVIVDVMIETSHGQLCIDAKFPLENYLKLVELPDDADARKAFINDVKKHLRDVAKKYILPDEGTLDSACMYVPSDAVMYEILQEVELTNLAAELRVWMLSPHTIQGFLQILYSAYQSQQFAENAERVLDLIRGMQQQNERLGTELAVLQKHLGNASGKLGDVLTEHGRLGLQISQANLLEGSAQPPAQLL
jgi:DNA recombination protein RmuC